MTAERARFILSLYHYGLPYSDLPGEWNVVHTNWHPMGITRREDFYIRTVWQTLDGSKSYYNALERIAGVSQCPVPARMK